jgi:CheY-like chemotaxis protein
MGLSVLIVDDSGPFLEAARALLTRQGLEVLEVASTTEQALEHVRALRPDVVLVDLNLGSESGFELTRQLLQDGQGRLSTVILMSTHAESDFADLIAESTAKGFLPKADLSADAIRLILDQPPH